MQIKSALQGRRNTFDLSHNHITTLGWLQANVTMITEMIPKSKIVVDMNQLNRLAPMPSPTFGRATFRNRAFFVPFRTIFPQWNKFISQLPDSKYQIGGSVSTFMPTVPLVTNENLCQMLISQSTEVSSTDAHDFVYYATGPVNKYIKLTDFGRYIYKILNQLGYHPNFNQVITSSEISWPNREYSALPILALARIYYDWYSLPQFQAQNAGYKSLEAWLNIDTQNKTFSSAELYVIFWFLYQIGYDPDRFTSAWQNPVGPNLDSVSSLNASILINDITTSFTDNYTNHVDNTESTNGTPTISKDKSSLKPISQYMIDTLHAVTDWVMRNRNVGSRVLDRIRAIYGTKLDSTKLDRSIYIDSLIQDLTIGDVMSMSDTDGANLGSYAGKGISFGQSKKFTFETDEFGYFIIVTTVVPEIGYYQGQRTLVERKAFLQFFRPEFDALGSEAIPERAIMTHKSSVNGGSYDDDTVFGWCPRYTDYKTKLSELTGDFVCDSVNTGKESWHLFRSFADTANPVLGEAFCQGGDWSQYQRIFYAASSLNDKFISRNHFNVKFIAPMKRLYDTYDFHDGQDLTVDVGGTKLN